MVFNYNNWMIEDYYKYHFILVDANMNQNYTLDLVNNIHDGYG